MPPNPEGFKEMERLMIKHFKPPGTYPRLAKVSCEWEELPMVVVLRMECLRANMLNLRALINSSINHSLRDQIISFIECFEGNYCPIDDPLYIQIWDDSITSEAFTTIQRYCLELMERTDTALGITKEEEM